MPRQRDADLLKALGIRLQRARKERGWTQEELAEAMSIEPVTLSRYETGDRALSISILDRAASALGVSIADLLELDRRTPRPKASHEESEAARIIRRLSRSKRDLAIRILREVAR